jgi:Fe-S oxidoreductase
MLEAPSALVAEVAARSGQNLFACYQCGKCTAGCPFGFSPQRLVRLLQLGQVEAALADETVGNCAGCFTCAAGCPKGVDPVRIVRALRSLNGSNHGHRRRSWVFANNHRLAKLGSAAAPVSNWLLRLPGSGRIAEQLLGVHHERSLPAFARQTFPAWFGGHTPAGTGQLGTVLLFHDTFMDYNVPETGIAATALLEKAGFKVELTDSICCGRPMISKGYFDKAREHARANVARLYEQVRDGAFIVGCEPSCLLTVRDEYGDLLDDVELERQWRTVASRSLLIDEFLAGLAERGELGLTFQQPEAGSRSVLFHGHCHQKALADPAKSLALLRLAGYEPEFVNTACCGMAGAFGYEKEHYELSRAAGERELFPAVREHADAQVVVMGVSCRQQIEHFTGRPVRHLAQVLADAVP